MKFTVERDALAEAVTWVARALPTRPVVAVLGGLLLRAADDGLILSCFDYEVSARMRVPPGGRAGDGPGARQALVEITGACRAAPSSSPTIPTG
jgi:DNA polymerase III sliding clamp (beta) subunit (PCNA family)